MRGWRSGRPIPHSYDYFESINRDFTYHLTPIGAPSPTLYIATEIEGNRFRVAGGSPGLKVSWMVTGVRNDPYARLYGKPVEQAKPVEHIGTYLHPELYGQPPKSGLFYRDHSLLMAAPPIKPGGNPESTPAFSTPNPAVPAAQSR